MSGIFDDAIFDDAIFDTGAPAPMGFIPRGSTADIDLPALPSATVTVPTTASAEVT